MTTQVVSFRASGKFLSWLESQQQENESLNQTASRLLKQMMDGEVYTESTTETHTVDTVYTSDKETMEDIAKAYYAQAMNQVNEAIATLRGEFEQRLGEWNA